MKILHVIDNLSMGGAQSLLVELLPIQKEIGNEVTVLELQQSTDRTFANQLEDKGINILYLSKSKSVRSFSHIFKLIPYLKKYDVIHVHLFPANYWVALAKFLSRCKTPILTTEHSTTNKRRNIPILGFIEKIIYGKYQQVVACADKAYNTFHAKYPKVNCISIPNGVQISKYMSAIPYSKYDLLKIKEDDFVFTMVARFNYPKRQDTIVEALSFLPKKFNAVLVGGSPEDLELLKIKNLAQRLGVLDRVHFLYVRSDIPRILKTSDAVVLASEYEGLSLSSIEGMASGRPFIATNVNGLGSVVDGAGILFKCGNSKELAKVLIKLDSDKEYYNHVIETCLKRASEYDIHLAADKYQKVYMELLGQFTD